MTSSGCDSDEGADDEASAGGEAGDTAGVVSEADRRAGGGSDGVPFEVEAGE